MREWLCDNIIKPMFSNALSLSANFINDKYASHYISFDFKCTRVPDECENHKFV